MSSAKVESLLGSFQDKKYKVRREALFETAKYASKGEFNKKVLVFLTKFLSDEDKAARSTAAWTLGKYAQNKLYTKSAIGYLTKMLKEEGERDIITNATYALANYAQLGLLDKGDLGSEVLIKLVNSKFEKVRANAAIIIGFFAEEKF